MKFPRWSGSARIGVASAVALAMLAVGPVHAQGTPTTAASATSTLKYPATPRGGQADDLSGIRVADPYRWLETITSPEVRNWVTAQNATTEGFLARVAKRAEIRDLVSHTSGYPRATAPFAAGERSFFYENSGLENQSVLYVQDRLSTTPRVLIDPNAFSSDGLIAIVDQAASPDGRYLAYAVTTQGSAWRVVHVRDVRSSQDTGDEIHGIKEGPISWTNDARGFFYTRVDASHSAQSSPLATDGRQQVYYHRLGRPQSDDRLMFESVENPSWRLRADVSDDGQYLVISARYGFELQNRLFLIDLDNPKRPNLGAPIVKLFDAGDAVYEFAGNRGPVFYIRTTKNAPRARLVAVDINTPDENHWTTVIRQTYDPLIELVRIDDRLVAHRLQDAHSVLELYGLDGSSRGTIPLPGIGTVSSMSAHAENRELYFNFSSFLQPPAVYRYDLDARNTTAYKEARVDSSFAQYETAQLYFTSKDGTRVPMFITARRGIKLDGSHPTILAGNGAFNESSTPIYSPAAAAWLRLGGIYAVANVRGGGEYGKAWHEKATGAGKQVSFDDFIAAAEFLISQRYTRPASLAVAGRGAGGLLVAAAVTQRPELFGAAVIDAGVLDMARFSRYTIGPSWMPEFGSPDRPNDLRALLAYSPLHNVKTETRFPPTLLCVGDHDEVVTPAHSYKFAAMLQASAGPSPALLRVDYDIGFGPGIPIARQVALDADRLTFIADALHVTR